MGKFITLHPETLKELRKIDSCLVSYNVEMTEVTGGTFWKAYTPEQVDGIEEFPVISDWRNMANLQQYTDAGYRQCIFSSPLGIWRFSII